MSKYIIADIKYRRTTGDYIRVIETLEENYPNYEFCAFIGEYTALMRIRNIRKEKLEKINRLYPND